MTFELSGKLSYVDKIQEINQNFRKREFVIEVENSHNNEWNDFVKFQLIQDRCDLIEPYEIDDNLKVSFNIKGRKWEKNDEVNYFTNLEAWRIQKLENETKDESEIPTSDELENKENESSPEFFNNNNEEDLPF